MVSRIILTFCLLLGVCTDIRAQLPSASPSPQDSAKQPSQAPLADLASDVTNARRVKVLQVTGEIKIDGRLDEEAWNEAQAANNFRQEEPTEGAPASEATEVRVIYDDKNLYVGIHAFDSEPARINSRELVRDASFSNDDKVEILLDTYHDRRNGFRFAVNPLGVQQDALITDEGRDVNLSWDTRWLSASHIDATGWTVEIAIPLTTLRFKEGLDTWGFNVARELLRMRSHMLGAVAQMTAVALGFLLCFIAELIVGSAYAHGG